MSFKQCAHVPLFSTSLIMKWRETQSTFVGYRVNVASSLSVTMRRPDVTDERRPPNTQSSKGSINAAIGRHPLMKLRSCSEREKRNRMWYRDHFTLKPFTSILKISITICVIFWWQFIAFCPDISVRIYLTSPVLFLVHNCLKIKQISSGWDRQTPSYVTRCFVLIHMPCLCYYACPG